jgi:uncharacterized protein YbaP (TraB family)
MAGRVPALILALALCVSAIGSPLAVSSTASTSSNAPAAGQIEEIEIIGERPGPRLWKVTRGDHVLWILGTLGHLPRKMRWRSSEVESVIAQSQQVLASGPSVSANIGKIAEVRLYFQWRGAQKTPNKSALKDWLPAPLYARFETQKARFDSGDSRIEELRPAFAALRLYEQALDAAGLSWHDQSEQTVFKLAAQQHVPVRRATLSVEDPSGALREVSALPPSLEVSCLETTIARLETDLPRMQERAAAWSVGDVDRLRQLSFADQREACVSALSNSPRMRSLFDRAAAAWDNDAEWALMTYRVSFAMRPIYELLAADGTLARFRAKGYTVEGP